MSEWKRFFSDYIRNNILKYLLLLLILSLGILAGAMAVSLLPEAEKNNLSESLNIFFDGVSLRSVSSLDMFVSVWWLHLKTLLLVWLLGFTIIGVPFIVFILFMRGFVIGFTVGFLVQNFFLRGLAVALTAVLPHNLIVLPIYLTVCCAAVSFSLYLIKKRTAAGQKLISAAINYTFLCLLFASGTFFSSGLEVYIMPVLTDWLLWLF